MWDTVKAVLRGKLVTLNAYIRKEGGASLIQFSELKNLGKEQNKPNISKRQEVIKEKKFETGEEKKSMKQRTDFLKDQ